jgi:hypothetical protein
MRIVTVAGFLLAGVIGSTAFGSAAFAQHVHHRYCLTDRGHKECAYDTLAQCKAARTGNAGHCSRNSAPMNH